MSILQLDVKHPFQIIKSIVKASFNVMLKPDTTMVTSVSQWDVHQSRMDAGYGGCKLLFKNE